MFGQVTLTLVLAILSGKPTLECAIQGDLVEMKIRSLTKDLDGLNKDDQLTLLSLLLHRQEYQRIIDIYESRIKNKEEFHIRMAYLQATIAKKDHEKVMASFDALAKTTKTEFIPSRKAFYVGLTFLEKQERGSAVALFERAIHYDPTFEIPYYYLSVASDNKQDGLIWAIKALSLVQPDTEFAKKTAKRVIECLR